MSRNLAASIRARLKQHADAAKQDFNLTLTHYGLERLLYRLSISAHAPNFLLKGALLFSLWYDLPAPQLRAYPKYTVVAEKFHAICLLGMANTRMKDYFDLWVLLGENTLDQAELHRAIEATFNRRKMAMPASLPAGLSDAFVADAIKQTQWNAFLNKNRLEAIALADVATRLRGEFHKVGVI